VNTDLCYLGAAEALDLFRARKLSPVELMDAVIARAERVEPGINALCFRYFDEAREHSRRAEQAWAQGTAGILEGLPLAVKDEAAIAGKITTNGSLLLRDSVATETEISVRRLLNAGAIVHARTTTPELSCAFVTWSKLWGVTRNPWNPAVTPGGSTGGGAAALAAGTAQLATGTDIAGSIRMPAAMCGIVGFKPPYGRIPQHPPWNLDTYSHDGPMARSVADCALMQNVLCGPHPSDPASLWPKVRIPPEFENIRHWRIGFSTGLDIMDVDEDVRRETLRAVELFRGIGAKVDEVRLGWDRRKCEKTAMIHLSLIMGAYFHKHYGAADQRGQLTSYVNHFLDASGEVSPGSIVAEMEYTNAMQASLGEIFRKYRVLIVPTVATTRIAADFDYSRDEVVVRGKRVNPFLGWTLTWPFNALSRCPVLSVPCGRADNGVPVGIQIIGRPYDDISVFQAGSAFEAAMGGPFIRENNRPLL
jgi:amidase